MNFVQCTVGEENNAPINLDLVITFEKDEQDIVDISADSDGKDRKSYDIIFEGGNDIYEWNFKKEADRDEAYNQLLKRIK